MGIVELLLCGHGFSYAEPRRGRLCGRAPDNEVPRGRLNMPSENCPDEPMIARFAHGLLPEGVAESVVAHIETCAPCSPTAEEHARQGDRLIDELRDASHDNVPPDADCERTLRQLRQIDVASVLSRQPEEETVAPERIRDYQIAEKLGEGGMGIVFKAVHTRMDRTVAIKILSQRHLSRPDRVKRFEREVKAIARLEHPNIVRATDAGEEDGVPLSCARLFKPNREIAFSHRIRSASAVATVF